MTTTLEQRPTREPIEDDTAFLITDAGLDALRITDSAMPVFGAQEAADAVSDHCAGEDAFTPDTREKADWVLSKIADAKARAARIRENAETMAKQAEAEATFMEWRYGAALQAFARQELAGGKRKSLTLYHGCIGFRTKPAGVQIGDPNAALTWARENLPAAVTETFDRKAVTAALLATGEAVDFAAFTLPEDVFFIK